MTNREHVARVERAAARAARAGVSLLRAAVRGEQAVPGLRRLEAGRVNAPAKSRSKGVRTRSPWGSYHAVPADALLPYPVACTLGADRSQYLYLRRCCVCGQAKPMFSWRKTCGNNCKGVLIGITRSMENTAKMQAVSHANTTKRAELRDLEELFAYIGKEPDRDLVVRAYRKGRRRGYTLGETRGICRERRAWEEDRR